MVANLDLYESIERSKFYKIEYQKLLIDIKINVKMKIAVALVVTTDVAVKKISVQLKNFSNRDLVNSILLCLNFL